MMPRWAAVLFLMGVGGVLLWSAYQGYLTGELRAGTTLLGPYRPSRYDNPVGFYFYLGLYFCIGIGLCVWALLVMLGMAPGVKWR